ncbi:MAG TPA: MXAN_5187 C-terminal domain-containing protein, partial [Kofleriaceae bacterium]|nr:MXAN_5187 C-terminal domain-containing protein [Kofleriaceae bacterium]
IPPPIPPPVSAPPVGSRTTTNRHPSTQVAMPVPPPAPPPGGPRPVAVRPSTEPPVSGAADPAGASQQMPAVSPAGPRPTGPRPLSPRLDPDSEEAAVHPAQPTVGTRIAPPRPSTSLETRLGFGPFRPPSNPGLRIPGAPSAPIAPSQAARPSPIAPGSSNASPPAPVETMGGPFPREAPAKPGAPAPRPKTPPRTAPEPRAPPPPGMTDADVNALYAKYVKAKEMVGEAPDPGAYHKLLSTIHAQAPKIMERYKAKGVDFSVVVKDNQVIIRAKPKP